MKEKLIELSKKLLLLSLVTGAGIGVAENLVSEDTAITYVYEVYDKQIDENNNEEWVLINKELELNKDITDGRFEYSCDTESKEHVSENRKFVLVNEYMDATKNMKKKTR